jgi:hypothetical protein
MCVSQVGDAIARRCGYAPRARSDTVIRTPPKSVSCAMFLVQRGVLSVSSTHVDDPTEKLRSYSDYLSATV